MIVAEIIIKICSMKSDSSTFYRLNVKMDCHTSNTVKPCKLERNVWTDVYSILLVFHMYLLLVMCELLT